MGTYFGNAFVIKVLLDVKQPSQKNDIHFFLMIFIKYFGGKKKKKKGETF